MQPTYNNHLEQISSLQNPRIKAICKLEKHRHRREANLFVAQGLRQIQRALTAKLKIVELFWCPSLLKKKPPNAPASFSVSEKVIAKLSYRENPEGIVATFQQPHWTLKQVLDDGSLWLIAVGIEKPGNLGAMIRTADAAGANGVFIADGVCDPFSQNALHASTGAALTLPVIGDDQQTIIEALRMRDIQIIATSPSATRNWAEVDLTRPTAIVIGPEDRGLDETWLNTPHTKAVKIPMLGQTADSLNASVSAAIVLFEAVRQRQGN